MSLYGLMRSKQNLVIGAALGLLITLTGNSGSQRKHRKPARKGRRSKQPAG